MHRYQPAVLSARSLSITALGLPMRNLNYLHSDSALRVADGAAFRDPISFHSRMKNANITQSR
jgi:hypothetical protein